jgi:hypothetical protein
LNNAGQKIYGQFISTDGSLLGGNFMICDNTSQERWWPAVAVSDSNFIAVWGQGYGSACTIWGNVDVSATGVAEDARYRIHDSGRNLTVIPNPFHHTTEIRFMIHDSRCTEQELRNSNFAMRKYTLKIYDATGCLVKSFDLGSSIENQESAVSWNGTDSSNRKLPGGVYFVKLEAGDHSATEKVILTR